MPVLNFGLVALSVAAFLVVSMIILACLELRNRKLEEFELRCLEGGTYENLPSHGYMLIIRFWVWPLDKFLDKKHLRDQRNEQRNPQA